MLTRRELLVASIAALMCPRSALAKVMTGQKLSWPAFRTKMAKLAESVVLNNANQINVDGIGLQILKDLDITTSEFEQAVDASYETGNRYWLWQRLIKEPQLNGGILTIDNNQLVQLHNHPGATGIVRIISGEAEVWQFDETAQHNGKVELQRISHRILKAGDTATLTPDSGNIHALRSISKECRMLDFFIPPYKRSQRSWYVPLEKNWFDREKISCKKISQQDYTDA